MMPRRPCLFAGIAISAFVQIGTVQARDGIDLAGRPGSNHGLVTCERAIGRQAAKRLRDLCIDVSPATHPPCETRNSCALIEDEIARSCAIVGDGDAAGTPACKVQPSSTTAAVDVLRRFYEAIDAHDYATAYAMVRPDGGKRQTYDAFRQGYVATRSIRLTTGRPGEVEGAAGSSYVTIPVAVDVTLDDGERQHVRGSYVMRRINGPPTPPFDDLRWHIFSNHFDPE